MRRLGSSTCIVLGVTAVLAFIALGCGAGADSARGASRARAAANTSLPQAGGGGARSAAAPAAGGNMPAISTIPVAGAPNPSVDSNACASASVAAARVTPTVYFLIDGSGSMGFDYDGVTRWTALREALLGSSGVIPQLAPVVRFGLSIFAWEPSMDACPVTIDVEPTLGEVDALSSAYPDVEPGGGTPTGEALQALVDRLPDFSPPGSEVPPIVILATDGEPTGCEPVVSCDVFDLNSCLNMSLAEMPADYASTFAAAHAARAKSMPVWVLSLADGLDQLPDLQKTANIGAGLPEDEAMGATIYSPQDPDQLRQTLSELLGAALSCQVTLAGHLDVSRACEGHVLLNGESLACDAADGWSATDPQHIELRGAACTRFKSDPSSRLEASFPCDVVGPA